MTAQSAHAGLLGVRPKRGWRSSRAKKGAARAFTVALVSLAALSCGKREEADWPEHPADPGAPLIDLRDLRGAEDKYRGMVVRVRGWVQMSLIQIWLNPRDQGLYGMVLQSEPVPVVNDAGEAPGFHDIGLSSMRPDFGCKSSSDCSPLKAGHFYEVEGVLRGAHSLRVRSFRELSPPVGRHSR